MTRSSCAASSGCLQAQITEGWWSGELETNVTMTAEHVLLYRFLGLPIDESASGAIAHILHNQRSDGSWALYYDGPADLSTTIEAYVALEGPRRRPVARRNARALARDSSRRRRRQRARLHQDLARALRQISVARRAVAAAGDRRISRCGCRSISTTSPAGRAARSRR